MLIGPINTTAAQSLISSWACTRPSRYLRIAAMSTIACPSFRVMPGALRASSLLSNIAHPPISNPSRIMPEKRAQPASFPASSGPHQCSLIAARIFRRHWSRRLSISRQSRPPASSSQPSATFSMSSSVGQVRGPPVASRSYLRAPIWLTQSPVQQSSTRRIPADDASVITKKNMPTMVIGSRNRKVSAPNILARVIISSTAIADRIGVALNISTK